MICRKSLIALLTLLLWQIFLIGKVSAQTSQRQKTLVVERDTNIIDTLSMIPGTVRITQRNGLPLDTSCWRLDPARALLIRSKPCPADTLEIHYKTFPFLLSDSYRRKDISLIQNNQYGTPYIYSAGKQNQTDFFRTEGLSRSGSISRGLSFGNNQDVVLNSSLNLQLAGKLSDQVDLVLAATDQNIPVQPDGNTQQLQEFDKVFIQFGIKDLPGKGKTILTAGDFQQARPRGYFMNYNKKLQGLRIQSEWPGSSSQNVFRTIAAAAVSKGKFARNASIENKSGNTFNGQKQERNQGPYKLRGSENEQYIIVLAGTESVYLDGQLLERGQDRDYVIDYNTAELIFTPRQLITKDVRIVAEFQYSDKNYARSMMHVGTELDAKKIKSGLHFYSESDNKNRPLQQDLTDQQKLLLAGIGDTLQNAWTLSADSVGFNTSEVLYDRKDTLVGTGLYKDVYVYSTDSSKAHYRLAFTYVGAGKGNYRSSSASANGKVYEWIVPDTLTGLPRGSYEPVRLLITPKTRQMVTAGAEWKVSRHSRLMAEGAMSRYDVNTFSPYEKANDAGFGTKLNWDLSLPVPSGRTDSSSKHQTDKDPMNLIAGIQYEFLQSHFTPIERFRPVEFERDWNRPSASQKSDQHIASARIGLTKKENLLSYEFRTFLEGTYYEGRRHGARVNWSAGGFQLNADGSYLDAASYINTSKFMRHQASLSKKFPIRKAALVTGIRSHSEDNLFRSKTTDTLLAGSLRFFEWQPFVDWIDSSGNKYSLFYKQRNDQAPYWSSTVSETRMERSTFSESFGGAMELIRNPRSQLRLTGSYRRLSILNAQLTSLKPENTLIGRAEYNFDAWKGLITSGTFYEVGSGLEVKKDFIFLEVAPGQGTHIWSDYNGNGIRELNEFEVSPFPQEANFLKLWVPTDDYISAFTNQFSEVLTLNPSARWSQKKGLRKFLSKFSNQAAYRTDRKTTNSNLAIAYHPFLSDTKDSTLVTLNSSFRNTFSILPMHSVFNMDVSWQDMRNKTLLENDTSTRQNKFYDSRLRWNMNRRWSVQGQYKEGFKENESRLFASRNFRIHFYELEPRLNFQSGSSFRISVAYKHSEKKNMLNAVTGVQARSIMRNSGAELRYSSPGKGILTLKMNYIYASFNDTENSSLGYEMLDGLKEGNNYTWSVSYSRNLSGNIQLTLLYDGRQSKGIRPIHTGNAQVRAHF